MKSLSMLFAAFALLLSSVGLAAAVETGTPGWTVKPVTLLEGPGAAYHIVGDVEGEQRIYAERCQMRWCRIRAGSTIGWVSIDYLSFGQEPNPPFSGPRLNYKAGGPGTVCLYEGADYTGASICGTSGFVVRDLLTYGKDNRYSSVSIEGNVSVTLCRDRFFRSYCERVNDSQPVLQGFLDDGVSSLRIY